MKPQREQIAELLIDKPFYGERKNRYNLVAEILEKHYGLKIEPKDCQLICSLADEYRHQTEVDFIGEKLARGWHKSPAMHERENAQLFQLRNITS